VMGDVLTIYDRTDYIQTNEYIYTPKAPFFPVTKRDSPYA